MNLLIGGENPVAVDAVTMRVMGLDPIFLLLLRAIFRVLVQLSRKILRCWHAYRQGCKLFKQPFLNLKAASTLRSTALMPVPAVEDTSTLSSTNCGQADPADSKQIANRQAF